MISLLIMVSWMLLLLSGFDDSVPPTGDKTFKIETRPDIVESIEIISDEKMPLWGFDIELKQNYKGYLEIMIPKNLPTPASFTNKWYHDEVPFVLANGKEVSYDIIDDPCHDIYKISVSNHTEIEFTYAVILGGTWQLYSPVQFDESHPCYHEVFYEELVDSPLKQLRSGVTIDEIQCRTEMVLITKSSDGSPACVTSETKRILIERGWAIQDSNDTKTTAPYCKSPLYVLDPDTNTCITNEELPKCTGNTTDNDTMLHCRISVTCDKEFDPDTMGSDVSALPQCKPLRECPDGFLVAIFPVNGDDALCEREDRKILSGVYYSYEQRVLTTSGVDAKENANPSKPINLNGTKEQRTIQISVITSGWYEKLGNPQVVIESNGNQIEQFALDLKNNKPGQTIHGVEYVLSEDLPDGTITIRIDMPGYDLLSPQSFSVKHISD